MLATSPPLIERRDSVLIFLKSEAFAQSLKTALQMSGYHTTAVTTEAGVFAEVSKHVPSVIILDCHSGSIRNFRRMNMLITVPIVAVYKSLSTDEECLQEYDEGIDLIVPEHSVRELIARIRAILRRCEAGAPSNITNTYTVGPIHMDLERHEVQVNRLAVELTPKEFQILQHFLESPHHVFSRQELLNRVWGDDYALEEHALDVHIHSLRQKIEQNPASPTFLVTIRGVGYKLRA